MTRFPCAHPAVIIKLEAVDDLRFMHTHIYEKLVVLSVDPDQLNALASYTSGGDTTLTRLPPARRSPHVVLHPSPLLVLVLCSSCGCTFNSHCVASSF